MEIADTDFTNASDDLEHCLELYKRFLKWRKLSPRTRVEYHNDLRALVTFLQEQLGVHSPARISLADLTYYVSRLGAEGFRLNTRRRKVAAIRGLFAFLSRQRLIAQDPSERLLPPERDLLRPRVLSDEECKALLALVTQEPRERALIELFLTAGLRLSEVTRLSLGNLDLPLARVGGVAVDGSVTIAGKGAKERVVPLPYRTCLSIKVYLKVRPAPLTPHLFLNKFGRGMTGRAIEYAIGKHLSQAGIQGASVHTLRHTYAVRLVRGGAGVEQLQEALGIADPRDVQAYMAAA